MTNGPNPDPSEPHFHDAVQAFFDGEQWPLFWREDDDNVATAICDAKNGRWQVSVHVRESQRQLLVYSTSPITVPPGTHAAAAEFVLRANRGMVLGNFEFDPDDGECRFKTSIDVGPTRLQPELISPLVYAGALMMDQYLPGLIAVMGGVSPSDAIAHCEHP